MDKHKTAKQPLTSSITQYWVLVDINNISVTMKLNEAYYQFVTLELFYILNNDLFTSVSRRIHPTIMIQI